MDADARWLVVARGSFGNVRPLIETFGRIRGFRWIRQALGQALSSDGHVLADSINRQRARRA